MRSQYGKFALLTAAIITITSVSFGLYSQENITEPGNAPEGKLPINSYNPLAITDPRFIVDNLNFSKRYASNGEGEILDISFDITNLTSRPIELSAYVMAFWETDAVDKPLRTYIPYPQWRIYDPDKRQFLVHYNTITPRDIKPEEIWDDKDPDFKRFQVIVNRRRNSIAGNRPIFDFNPPFWKYLSYMAANPTKGLNFKLHGRVGPTLDKVVQSNYIPPTPEEKKNKLHKTLAQHKYTLLHNRRKVEFRSHHFSRYRADFNFFNMVSIVLFDRDKAAEAAEQAGRQLEEGEVAAEPMVYKAIRRLNPKMIRY